MTPRQALAAWSVPALALLGVGAGAAAQGWWWVVAFCMVDGGVWLLACLHYCRHALDGDTLVLDDHGQLHLQRQCGPRVSRWRWSAAVVRLDCQPDGRLRLRAGRECLRVGDLAAWPQRRQAARELRERLDAARRGTGRG